MPLFDNLDKVEPNKIDGKAIESKDSPMRYRLRTLLIVLVVVGLSAFVIAGWRFYSESVPWGLIEFIPKTYHMNVSEGLPHQIYEKELLNSQLDTKQIRYIRGLPFYLQTLSLDKNDEQQLANILANRSTWRRFTGEKKCGGFHPDYAVEFEQGKSNYLVLLCFGCGEARVFGPAEDSRYNVSLEARQILDRYQKNRPNNPERFR